MEEEIIKVEGLTKDTDFTVSGNSITLKNSWLSNRQCGINTLVLNGGTNLELTITNVNTPVLNYSFGNVTGNTVIDALYWVIDKIKTDVSLDNELEKVLHSAGYDINRLLRGRKLVLITGHRRENFGDGFISICTAIKDLAQKYLDVDFVYPMHLNPNVRNPIHQVFGENLANLGNMFFIEPLEYLSFVYLMEKATVVLTDSGGIQEEAPGLGKPVLVMRDTTERPEALDAGTVKLVGTNYDKIVNEVSQLLEDEDAYEKMSKAVNPYGDGMACRRIVEFVK